MNLLAGADRDDLVLDHFAVELALANGAWFADAPLRRRPVCIIDDCIESVELAHLTLCTEASQVLSYVQISLEHAHSEA